MRRLETVIGMILALMVVLVFGNVVLRYGFNSGITVSEESSRYLFHSRKKRSGAARVRRHHSYRKGDLL
jgi:TRAP-type mannitol/chloroaromatic compound transport system permease small subunit